jgi:hypothetical protein
MRLLLKAGFAFAAAAILTGQWRLPETRLKAEAAEIAAARQAAHRAAPAPVLFQLGTK